MTPTAAATARALLNAGEPDSGAKGNTVVRELSRVQQTIARRMSQSRSTVPDFELRRELDMSAVVALREQLRAVTEPAPSYNDFMVRPARLRCGSSRV